MKLAAVTSLFKYYSLPEALRVIAASGYEGVELWSGLPHAYVEDFFVNGALDDKSVSTCRTLISNSGLKPVQFLPEQCFYPVNFVIGDAPPFDGTRLRARAIDYFERSINLAAALGKSSDFYFDQHIDALGKRLVHIHLSDNFGDLDAHLIPGKGSFDFSHAIASLVASGYDGYLSAEILMFGANPVPPVPGELLVATRQYMESLANA